MEKANQAFRNKISEALICGDGIGKPLGVLNPNARIPIYDTAAATPAGQFGWQDVVGLIFQIPMQWHAGIRLWMNQRTPGLLLTMTDGTGRPLALSTPITGPDGLARSSWSVFGIPGDIVCQMPDVLPGATPILAINPREAYLIVSRRGVTMLTDPYSAGYCQLYKFSVRIGGGVVCPNAAALLRVL